MCLKELKEEDFVMMDIARRRVVSNQTTFSHVNMKLQKLVLQSSESEIKNCFEYLCFVYFRMIYRLPLLKQRKFGLMFQFFVLPLKIFFVSI